MKISLVPFALSFALATPALAKSLVLDLRSDFDSASFNDGAKAADTDNRDNNSFDVHTARIDFKGEVTESLLYRFRFRLNNENTTTSLDNISNRVDYALLTHKMDSLALTFGKFVTDVGGHETIGDSRDVYLKSEANRALTGNYDNLTGDTTFYQTKYATGLRVGYTLGDSGEIALMGANSPEAESTASPNPQNRLMTGLVWKGLFADKTWQPVLSYHNYKSNLDSASSSEDTESNLMAAGLKWTQNGHFAQVDYVQLDSKGLTLGADTGKFQVASIIGEFGYKFSDMWLARLKVESSKLTETPEAGAKADQDVMGYAAAFEYRPIEAQNFRYHLAWTQKTFKQDNVDDQQENHILVGAVFAHDFLK